MSNHGDWRDVFCGRKAEIAALEQSFQDVVAGNGPRLVLVLGDCGMGKTRLVQEFYRLLKMRHDTANYWPNASLFKGNNLRVAPDFADAETKAHFAGFTAEERAMRYLWWGFRLADPQDRNAARTDMAAHRRTLEPHLDNVFIARRLKDAGNELKAIGIEVGKSLVIKGIETIPIAGHVLAWAIEGGDKGRGALSAYLERRRILKEHAQTNLARLEQRAHTDIIERTLADLGAVLAPQQGSTSTPVIVFCDDAQFARPGGDEGALQLLYELWLRAASADWPLLLIASHWALDWAIDAPALADSFGHRFAHSANSPTFGKMLELSREPELARLVNAGLPTLAECDVQTLLRKADGNPQVLVELADLVQRSPAWRTDSGDLTTHGRAEIEAHSSDLTRLIVERLESDTTPVSVRRAVALASMQGMTFLCTLTDAASHALRLGPALPGLKAAERPHRLVVGADRELATFVQRAYCDAAHALVGGQVGDPAAVGAALLTAALAVMDDAPRWQGFSRDVEVTALGVFVGLAEDVPDVAIRHRAGQALLTLVARALATDQGRDYAVAAAFAARFVDGITHNRWNLRGFTLADLDTALQALSVWHGPAATLQLAQPMLLRARELHQQLGTPESQQVLGAALDDMGAVAQAEGDWRKAKKLYREGLEIARALMEVLGTRDAQRELAVSLDNVGTVAQTQGNWREAGRLYRESLDIRRELETELSTPEAQRDLSVALDNVAAVAQARGAWRNADKLYRESMGIARALEKLLGTPEARRDVAISLVNLGTVAQAQGNWAEADRLYQESLNLYHALEKESRTPEARRDLSAALDNVATVAEARGNLSEAEALYRKSLDIARGLEKLLGTPDSQRDLSVGLDNVAAVKQAQGDWLEAARLYSEGLGIARALERLMGTPEARRDVSSSLDHMGEVAQARGDWHEAGRLYGESLDISRALEKLLGTPEARRDVAIGLENMGAVAQAQGDCAEAGRHYRERLKISRALAKLLDTPESRRDLSVALENVGAVAIARGNWHEADQRFRESLRIRRALEDLLGTPEAKRDVAESFTTIAVMEIERGGAEAACPKLREALKLLELLNCPGAATQVRDRLQRTRQLIVDHCGCGSPR